jgi:hypothetical protein
MVKYLKYESLDFIAGLSNLDITEGDIKRALDPTVIASKGDPVKEVTWLFT